MLYNLTRSNIYLSVSCTHSLYVRTFMCQHFLCTPKTRLAPHSYIMYEKAETQLDRALRANSLYNIYIYNIDETWRNVGIYIYVYTFRSFFVRALECIVTY